MKLITIFLTMLLVFSGFQTTEAPLPQMVKSIESDETFTPDNLKKYIATKGLKHPHIVYAQAVLETGFFKSTIFKENNNLFGMRYVKDFKQSSTRPTTAIGSRYKHAVYTHWKESVDDYLLWQQMFKRTPTATERDYFRLLGKRYAEGKGYVSSLKYIIKQDTTNWSRLKQ